MLDVRDDNLKSNLGFRLCAMAVYRSEDVYTAHTVLSYLGWAKMGAYFASKLFTDESVIDWLASKGPKIGSFFFA